ncbi:VOC family protein [uncultured Amnibacterium sp.]|uniref:VOC family protein n=1 Tax=uncultured Amnibacterium sp. TaxID=1631851 RepID=UPI0035CC1C0E
MTVRALTWMARRVPAGDLDGLRAMGDALGLEVLAATPDALVLRTARGDLLEWCGPEHPVPEHLFASGDVVLGFEVDDLDATARRLADAGVAPLAAPSEAGGVRFLHVRGADGAVYGLIEPPPPPPD